MFLICLRWVRRCRGARRCRSTAATKLGHYPAAELLDTTMKMLGKIVLGAATFAMIWPATRLIIASWKRTEPPSKIITEAIVYIGIMFVISRIYRKL